MGLEWCDSRGADDKRGGSLPSVEIIAVLFTVVAPVAVFGTISYAVIEWQRRAKENRARTFVAIAQRYGFAASGEAAWGVHDGVAIVARVEYRQQGKSSYPYTVIETRIHPQLDLGLNIRRATGWPAAFSGIKDHTIGVPALDAAFLLGGDEAHRIAALLAPPLGPALLAASRTAEVVLNDGRIQIEEAGEPREPLVAWAIPMVSSLARALEATKLGVPPATPLTRLAYGYRAAAGVLGLTWMPTPLALGGTIEGIGVYSGAFRHGPFRYQAMGTAVFPGPLGCGFSVKSAKHMSIMDRVLATKDIPLGDEAFDEAFLVRANDEARAKHVLSAEVRSGLSALAEAGAIELRDDALQIRLEHLPEPHAVPPLIDKLARLASAIHARAAHEDVKQGPYR
jgi:hypothetical protein